jgi:hypothetical protein
MSIDKVFGVTEGKKDRETRVDTPAKGLSSHERPARMSNVTDFEIFLPKGSETPSNRAWQIRCDDCDPKRGGYYWFSLSQCDTPAKALDCIMHLNEERGSSVVMQSFIDLMEYLFGRGIITDE